MSGACLGGGRNKVGGGCCSWGLGSWGGGALFAAAMCFTLRRAPSVGSSLALRSTLKWRESKAAWMLCSSEGCAVPIAGNEEVRSM